MNTDDRLGEKVQRPCHTTQAHEEDREQGLEGQGVSEEEHYLKGESEMQEVCAGEEMKDDVGTSHSQSEVCGCVSVATTQF